jgi:hypothetical protein
VDNAFPKGGRMSLITFLCVPETVTKHVGITPITDATAVHVVADNDQVSVGFKITSTTEPLVIPAPVLASANLRFVEDIDITLSISLAAEYVYVVSEKVGDKTVNAVTGVPPVTALNDEITVPDSNTLYGSSPESQLAHVISTLTSVLPIANVVPSFPWKLIWNVHVDFAVPVWHTARKPRKPESLNVK